MNLIEARKINLVTFKDELRRNEPDRKVPQIFLTFYVSA